ncbi:PH domain-containing protein [Actinomyces vulturis]|uniref:PH domain-containing protein n=1 Tax=Actinomyces vulturis TaxID=1857645 RepID=UPI0008341C48|nr:PH domain-containing protein [Actinomyces vulturis]
MVEHTSYHGEVQQEPELRRLSRWTPILSSWKSLTALFGVLLINSGSALAEVSQAATSRWGFAGVIGIFLGTLAIVMLVLVAYSFLAWKFMSYELGEETVSVRSGILMRTHRSARYTRIQAVDITRPLIARFLGIGRLRVETAGGSDSNLIIQYLSEQDLAAVRAEILLKASGRQRALNHAKNSDSLNGAHASVLLPDEHRGGADEHDDVPQALHGALGIDSAGVDHGVEQRALTTDTGELDYSDFIDTEQGTRLYSVKPQTLIGATLRSSTVVISLFIIIAALLFVAGVMLGVGPAAEKSPSTRWTIASTFFVGAAPSLLIIVSIVWKRIVGDFNFTAHASIDGIRLNHGLFETKWQTIPPRRVIAVEMKQSLFWRTKDWWRVTMCVAGYEGDKEDSLSENVLLPVGNRDEAWRALWLVIPELGTNDPDTLLNTMMTGTGPSQGLITTPTRARWLHPLEQPRIAAAVTDSVMMIRTGFFKRKLIVMNHERSQSLRVTQNPLQQLLKLATVHLDIPHSFMTPSIYALHAPQAANLAHDQAQRAVQRRKTEPPEQWLARVEGQS